MDIIRWNLIKDSKIDNKSGIYAWYYTISIGDIDISNALTNLENASSHKEKEELLRSFLNKHFFDFYKEDNYLVKISGKLMPSFSGALSHVDSVSNSLIEKIIDSPECLWEIKKFLSYLSVDFSSPIYIGMAEDLCTRILKHKSLIEKFKREKITHDNFEDRDESFAARVVSRGMIETNLKVSIKYVEPEMKHAKSEIKLHNILENLLNRINYPVLGRN